MAFLQFSGPVSPGRPTPAGGPTSQRGTLVLSTGARSPPERRRRRMTPRCPRPGRSDFAADAASKSGRGLFRPSGTLRFPTSSDSRRPCRESTERCPPHGWASDSAKPPRPHGTKVAAPSAKAACRLGVPQPGGPPSGNRSLLSAAKRPVPPPPGAAASDDPEGRQAACSLPALPPAVALTVQLGRGCFSRRRRETAAPLRR